METEVVLKNTILDILIKASDVLEVPLEFLEIEIKYSTVTHKIEYTFYDVTQHLLLHIHGLKELNEEFTPVKKEEKK